MLVGLCITTDLDLWKWRKRVKVHLDEEEGDNLGASDGIGCCEWGLRRS